MNKDLDELEEWAQRLRVKKQVASHEWYKLALRAFELASTKQVASQDAAHPLVRVWLAHSDRFSPVAYAIGELAADLDVPVRHVQGGTAGAQARWHRIELLARSALEKQRWPDSDLSG